VTTSTIRLDDLSDQQLAAAKLALATLNVSVNVPTGTRVAAVAQTDSGMYPGAQLQLTLPSALHAEVAAICTVHSAGDLGIHALYLAARRFDGRDAGHVSPCGSCCQVIHDVATYTGVPITVLSVNEQTNTVRVIESSQLLPYAFVSHKLHAAREAHQQLNPGAGGLVAKPFS
jgi:cytidine deaminase